MLVGVLSSSHKYSCRIKGKLVRFLFAQHRRQTEESRKELRKYYVEWSNKSCLYDLDLRFCCFVSLSVLSMIPHHMGEGPRKALQAHHVNNTHANVRPFLSTHGAEVFKCLFSVNNSQHRVDLLSLGIFCHLGCRICNS